ncbi:pyrroloquinoline quinone-dependent dehydrogenase (plasmid) [Comamonadaceae bacterium OTU4NAUVB1]|nr:pyrroloquinoline quinone-dependent dehydrogenase [Comamonadaceae bacterium OTU4NAUVB1]
MKTPPALPPRFPVRSAGGWRLAGLGAQTLAGLLGLAMLGLGLWLATLGGSAYYALCGAVLAGGALAAWRGRPGLGVGLLAVALVSSIGWAFWEIAGKGWQPVWAIDLAARVGVIAGLFAVTLLAWLLGRPLARSRRRTVHAGAWATAGALAGAVAFAWERPMAPAGASGTAGPPPATMASAPPSPSAPPADTDWTAFGGTNAGRRFSPAAQITPANVATLGEAWRFHTGDTAPSDRVSYAAQNTPLKVGDALFVCSPGNRVFALDPATGAERWRFDPHVAPRAMESMFSAACRAVGHHARPDADALTPPLACARRVFVAAADGRLLALDAARGTPCTGFGQDGTVDLTAGLGQTEPGHASSNSGPAVVGDLVLVGQQVSDNQRRDAPSGVVRAYDATTGALRWAWDARRADRPGEPLAPGELWPRGTPNVWNVISADEGLGLVFLGTGNAGNDHFGGDRAPEDDRFGAAVVALDAASGAVRWVFRTVERDRFDYDIGAQPVVTDLTIDGRARRVVIQGTKTGSLFVLDAQTGQPVRPVARVAAPRGGMQGETLSPTQPQSVFYPNFAGLPGREPERLDARHAFGLTPVDAALCRIQFHRMRYEGMYTPPTYQGLGTLLYPGTIGGLNWGGLAIDPARGLVVTNHSRLANRVRLVPRADVADPAIGDGGRRPDQTVAPQKGAPWGVDRPIWLSPLGVPCNTPPWGFLAATDLATGALAWSRPLGTGFDAGPLEVPMRLRIPLGTPNLGGAVTTASGLTFIAAAQDDYLRAFETATGRLLWSGRLPAGGQASAMTYMHRGRQYVAIGATGHKQLKTRAGDALVVYALPP